MTFLYHSVLCLLNTLSTSFTLTVIPFHPMLTETGVEAADFSGRIPKPWAILGTLLPPPTSHQPCFWKSRNRNGIYWWIPQWCFYQPIGFFGFFLIISHLPESFGELLQEFTTKGRERRKQIDMAYRYFFHSLSIHPLYNFIKLCMFCSALELPPLQGTVENLALQHY